MLHNSFYQLTLFKNYKNLLKLNLITFSVLRVYFLCITISFNIIAKLIVEKQYAIYENYEGRKMYEF